jgi:hypothetical protein
MIVRRGSSYGVSVYDAALKRKRWVGTFETLRVAREAERNASRRRGSAARLTCREFVDLWLTNYARPAPATQRTYGYALRRFANDFGHVRLSAHALRDWCLISGTGASYIGLGSPWQNPWIESFNARLREPSAGSSPPGSRRPLA